MIILGIIVAVWVGERRWTARGGTSGTVIDIAVWAVPFGLIGGRIYHVITDNQLYFGSGKHPLDALKIWNGGLGIWGAVLLGAVGAYIGCRRRGINFRAFADVIAPGIAFAQAFGRWGNYFNQELYGRPLHAFFALHIDPEHRPRLADGSLDPKYKDIATYHPTFLYESIWCVLIGFGVIWAGRRYRLNWGRTFALYVAAYTVGRGYFEWLRIDSAHVFLGLRLNDYTAIVVFLAAVGYLYAFRDKSDTEEVLETAVPATSEAEPEEAKESEDAEPPTQVAEPASNVKIVDEAAEEAEHTEQPESEEPEEPAAAVEPEEPEAVEKSVEPEEPEPAEAAEPEAVEPEAAEPEAVEPEAAESKVAEPEAEAEEAEPEAGTESGSGIESEKHEHKS
jgi:prolipoprotein diacylglyceryl transferase